MVSNVPRKKKHKRKIKENLYLQLQPPNGIPNGCLYKKKEKGMGNNIPKKKNIKKR
jgi:hypothetical protein